MQHTSLLSLPFVTLHYITNLTDKPLTFFECSFIYGLTIGENGLNEDAYVSLGGVTPPNNRETKPLPTTAFLKDGRVERETEGLWATW